MSRTKVASGMRTAASAEPQSADELVKPQPIRFTDGGAPNKPYPTRFQSRCQHLILTFNIPKELDDGMLRDRKFDVVFAGGFVDITRKKYPFSAKVVSDEIRKQEGYGLGKLFWDADEFQAKAEADETAKFISQAEKFAQNPEAREALRAIFADDFALPKKGDSKPTDKTPSESAEPSAD